MLYVVGIPFLLYSTCGTRLPSLGLYACAGNALMACSAMLPVIVCWGLLYRSANVPVSFAERFCIICTNVTGTLFLVLARGRSCVSDLPKNQRTRGRLGLPLVFKLYLGILQSNGGLVGQGSKLRLAHNVSLLGSLYRLRLKWRIDKCLHILFYHSHGTVGSCSSTS